MPLGMVLKFRGGKQTVREVYQRKLSPEATWKGMSCRPRYVTRGSLRDDSVAELPMITNKRRESRTHIRTGFITGERRYREKVSLTKYNLFSFPHESKRQLVGAIEWEITGPPLPPPRFLCSGCPRQVSQTKYHRSSSTTRIGRDY